MSTTMTTTKQQYVLDAYRCEVVYRHVAPHQTMCNLSSIWVSADSIQGFDVQVNSNMCPRVGAYI